MTAPTPMQIARLETAVETLTTVIAIHTHAILAEQDRPNPDPQVIAALRHQRSTVLAEHNSLRLGDPDTIDQAIARHGPTVRRAFTHV